MIEINTFIIQIFTKVVELIAFYFHLVLFSLISMAAGEC